MNELTEQNQALLAEKVEYQNKKRTLSGREKSLESRENAKRPVRRVIYPLVNRLVAEAEPGTKIHRTKIQEEFLRELEAFPELKPAVQDALHTPQKAKSNTPLSWQVGQWKKFALPWASTLKQVQDATRNIETSLKSLASVKHFLRFLTQLAIS